MLQVVLENVDLRSLLEAVGAAAYASGLSDARERAVTDMWTDDHSRILFGTVHGCNAQEHTTAVFLSPRDDGTRRFGHSQCTCPDAIGCRHAVALLLTAADGESAIAGPAQPVLGTAQQALNLGLPDVPPEADPPQRPALYAVPDNSWAESLQTLLTPAASGMPGARSGTRARSDQVLAIEISMKPAPAAPYPGAASAGPAAGAGTARISARLVQPGKNGSWVAGKLSWGHLERLPYEGYPAAQVRLLRELYAVYRVNARRVWYGYDYGYDDGTGFAFGSGDERTIDLAGFESPRLWPLLDEAQAAGLLLVHPGKVGPAGHYRDAGMCLDITAGQDGGVMIIPEILIGGEDTEVVPLAFIGSAGHGLAYTDQPAAQRAEPAKWPVRLARLSRPVPAQLQQLALQQAILEVPASGLARFGEEFCPRLARTVTLASSDGSFNPPAVSGPQLLLHAAYGAGHVADLHWEWAYQVGDKTLTAALDSDPADDDGFRDRAAERSVLAAADLPLDRFGLAAGPGVAAAADEPLAPAPLARLHGTGTMRFTTELLPLLQLQPGVAVEISGEAADYREASDSLQIGVSTTQISGETDWFDLGITIEVEGREVPFLDVFTALARGEPYLLLADGAYFSLGKPELQTLAQLIAEARALDDGPPGELRISRFQAGLWDELAGLGVVSRQASAWQQQVQGLLDLGSDGAGAAAAQPAGLQATLRPYQLQGFEWLAFLWRHQLGGILADDMGLGKTLQTLALIAHARQQAGGTAEAAGGTAGQAAPFLIVAPTSVVPNWAAEAARFTPGLRVVAVTETSYRSGRDLAAVTAGADAVVTSYTLLRLGFAEYSALEWSGLILDEAQFAKNHQSKIYQCARRLQAPFKLAVTGTPMENNLMELWSLLSITAPGLFPSPARFRDYYLRPIEKQGHPELLAQLRRRIAPLVQRRTKEQVAADLPAKQEQVVEVELHPQHRKLYQTRLQRERQKVLGLIGDMNAHRFTIFRSLTVLRQLSLHAALVDREHAGVPSAKADTLVSRISEIAAGGHRALVFSQFTGFLAVVRAALAEAGIDCCYLDGKTRDRAAVLAEFSSGSAPVFLISLKAGGFGLNLTDADYCFLLDPWWNPATEAQAIDRTHRIGQTRNVMVYRFIAAGTIEEKVMALQERKRQLFADVIDGDGDAFARAITADDIRALLA